MWKKIVKDYLTFTKKDRVGLLVLVALIQLVVLLPLVWPAKKWPQPNQPDLAKIKELVSSLHKKETAPGSLQEEKEESNDSHLVPAGKKESAEKRPLFYFDPNTLPAEGWQRLGIRPKTTATILHYVSKGGKFRQAADIAKIYGLFKSDYERLLPFVRIAEPAAEKKEAAAKNEYAAARQPSYAEKRAAAPAPIDINQADTTLWIALPGIGSKLAARIVNFRERLGGFYSVEQVSETYALPDSTFNKIKKSLQCDHPSLKQININTADAATLKQHPYIRWNLANAIVQYRAQHGNFTSVNDLQLIAQVTPDMFEKIRPYVTIN